MLPQPLRSTYKTYKEDTDSVAAWLAVQAKKCGYSADLLDQQGSEAKVAPRPTGRLKGKARKQAKGADHTRKNGTASAGSAETARSHSYTIRVREFVPLAEYVAASSKPLVQVPGAIASALGRAIRLRKQQYSELSQERASNGFGTSSDDSHMHFLGILEQTQEVLRPRMLSNSVYDPNARNTSHISVTASSDDSMVNKYKNLDIEEPSQDFIDAPEAPKATTVTSADASNYQAETVNNLQEEYLAAHCLFQDIKDIRNALRSVWDSYQLQGLDTAAISLSVNTAITFVRDMEHDLLQHFPSKTDYDSISGIFYGAQCLHQGHDPSHRQRPGDLINLAVYDLAESVMMPTFSTMCSLSDILERDVVPVYKPGHFGLRNTSVPWSQKSPREKLKDDQIVMFEAFSDLSLLAIMLDKSPLAEDELIRGIRGMARGKPISLGLVFAMQCFLDAQHILGPNLEGSHVDLQAHADIIRATIKATLDFHKSLRVDTWPKQNDFVLQEQLRVIQEYILTDMVGDRMKKVAVSRISPPYSLVH